MSAQLDPEDYRRAISRDAEDEILNADWADKPHRLVYDLCNEVERLTAKVETLSQKLTDRGTVAFSRTIDGQKLWWWTTMAGAGAFSDIEAERDEARREAERLNLALFEEHCLEHADPQPLLPWEEQ